MFNRVLARTVAIGFVVLVGLSLGCGSNGITKEGLFSITGVSPATLSTFRTTAVNISGARFQTGATVTIGGISAAVTAVTSTAIAAVAPVHEEGWVDVVVTNPDGQSCTLTRGASYVFVAAPTVASISPSVGSSGGGTSIILTGTRLEAATVTLGGIAVRGRFDRRDQPGTTMYFDAPAHAEGVVDVIVTTPDGQTDSLPGGYTYAPQGSFDLNGSWFAYGNNGQDIGIEFIIQNNLLLRVSCETGETVIFASPPVVSDGAVSASRNGGVIFSARMVSPDTAVGTIEIAPCSSSTMEAWKVGAGPSALGPHRKGRDRSPGV